MKTNTANFIILSHILHEMQMFWKQGTPPRDIFPVARDIEEDTEHAIHCKLFSMPDNNVLILADQLVLRSQLEIIEKCQHPFWRGSLLMRDDMRNLWCKYKCIILSAGWGSVTSTVRIAGGHRGTYVLIKVYSRFTHNAKIFQHPFVMSFWTYCLGSNYSLFHTDPLKHWKNFS